MTKKKEDLERDWKESLRLEGEYTRLRWEFLRRNPEYRKDWDRELPIYLEREKKFRSDPKYKDSPLHNQPIISVDNPMFKLDPGNPEYLFKWGMYDLINPDQDKAFPLDFEETYGQIKIGSGPEWLAGGGRVVECIKGKFLIPTLPEGKASVVFDLRIPLRPQFARMELVLENRKKDMKEMKLLKSKPKRNRQKIELYKRYLKIYDLYQEMGEDCRTEIAKKVFPKDFKNYDELSESDPYLEPERAKTKVMQGYKEAKRLILEGLPP